MTTPTPSQHAALERLIDAISPTPAIARGHKEQFDAESVENPDEDFGPLWLLKDVVDWETGYFVDWKDTESFVQCVTQVAEAWGATLTFSVEDPLEPEFLESNSVPELMMRAYAELAPQGLTLWNWATQGDCYCGWVTKSDAAPSWPNARRSSARRSGPAANPSKLRSRFDSADSGNW